MVIFTSGPISRAQVAKNTSGFVVGAVFHGSPALFLPDLSQVHQCIPIPVGRRRTDNLSPVIVGTFNKVDPWIRRINSRVPPNPTRRRGSCIPSELDGLRSAGNQPQNRILHKQKHVRQLEAKRCDTQEIVLLAPDGTSKRAFVAGLDRRLWTDQKAIFEPQIMRNNNIIQNTAHLRITHRKEPTDILYVEWNGERG